MKRGYIYILSNPSIPDLVKIGRSVNGGKVRAVQIYNTGVPRPFRLEFEILVSDAVDLELRIHKRLRKYRLNENREFFSVTPARAILEILGEFATTLPLEPINPQTASIRGFDAWRTKQRIIDGKISQN